MPETYAEIRSVAWWAFDVGEIVPALVGESVVNVLLKGRVIDTEGQVYTTWVICPEPSSDSYAVPMLRLTLL